jgi:LCP family protein required for cell wall assembly
MAAFLSALFPGLGQAAGGRSRRGGIVAIPAIALAIVLLIVLIFSRRSLTDGVFSSQLLISFLIVNTLAGLYHLWAIVDAYFGVDKGVIQGIPTRGASKRNSNTLKMGLPILLVLLVVTSGAHLFIGVVINNGRTAADCLFDPGGRCVAENGGNYGNDPSVPDVSGDPGDTTPGPSLSAMPAGTPVPGWASTVDAVKVRSGAGTSFAIITTIAKGTRFTGQVVSGGAYSIDGVAMTDWIKIDDGQALAGGYAAKGYFDEVLIEPATPKPSTSLTPIVYPTTSLPPASSVNTKWDADGYLNVLLVGADSGAGRASMRTDTMILLQVKTSTGQAAMYGIPRNLFNVPLPPQWADAWDCHCFYGYYGSPASGGNYMLNALWQWGAWRARDKFPGTGATTDFERGFKVLEGTIGELTGTKVDGVVYINLLGFVKLIDDLGGVEMYVPKRLYDARMPKPDGPGTFVLDIAAGQHHFDGQTALAYARSRHSSDDTDRMARQQSVIKAIRNTVNPCTILPSVPALLSDLGGMLWTDLPREDAARVAGLASVIGGNNVQSFSFIPQNGYPEYVTPAVVAKIRDTVAHGLDKAPKSSSGGGSSGGGGGFSC